MQWFDVVDFFRHLRWVLFGGALPRFERWGWWEKFDYWAVWWGLIIVGATGLLIYNPVLSADYVPGWFYNVALWIHRIEAVLAMGHIFTVHFFVEHFRPSTFPFSATMFDGGMPLEHARAEHPRWVERLEREGQLQARLMSRPVWGLLHRPCGPVEVHGPVLNGRHRGGGETVSSLVMLGLATPGEPACHAVSSSRCY
jgi:hypothetical protein